MLDEEAPTISNLEENLGTINACSYNLVQTPTITDNVSLSAIAYSVNGTSNDIENITGNLFNSEVSINLEVGTYTIVWEAMDENVNISTFTQNITVADNENPTISGLELSITEDLISGSSEASITLTPTISDNCGIEETTYKIGDNEAVTFTGTSVSLDFAVGEHTVLWETMDVNGNVNDFTQTITVNSLLDEEAPTISNLEENLGIVNVDGNCAYSLSVNPITNDNVGVVSLTYEFSNQIPQSVEPGTTSVNIPLEIGNYSILWTAKDLENNTANFTQNITVEDNELPIISIENITENVEFGIANIDLSIQQPTITDNCEIDNSTLINNFNGTNDASDLYPIGITNVVWNVSDVNGNQATYTQIITVTVDGELPKFDITGNVNYLNNANTLVTNANVQLLNNGTLVYETSTDGNGNYTFSEIITGNYDIKVAPSFFGGVNATDALLTALKTVELGATFTNLQNLVADVNNSNEITTTDALLIMRRGIGMDPHYTGVDDWRTLETEIVVSENITKNLQTICNGDVNASYVPNNSVTKKSISNDILLTKNGYIENENHFEYPISIENYNRIGAMSLILNIPNSWKINNIRSEFNNLIYKLENNQVFVYGYSVNGKDFENGENLIILEVEKENLFSENLITIDSKSELTDENAKILKNINLNIPSLENETDIISMKNYPNPASISTNFEYNLIENSKVELKIFDMLGKEVAVLVNKNQEKGIYKVNFDISNFSKGMYIYKMVIKTKENNFTEINKLSIK